MAETFELLAAAPFWIAVLRIATPLIIGTLGVLLCERAGVLNLGIEGIMVAGAFAGWLAVYLGAGLWVGVLVAALVGAALGLLHGLLTVLLSLSQHVSGLGITLLATSVASYAYRVSFPKVESPPTITRSHWPESVSRPFSALRYQSCQEVALRSASLPQWPASCGQWTVKPARARPLAMKRISVGVPHRP